MNEYIVTGYDAEQHEVPIVGENCTTIRSDDWNYIARVVRQALERGAHAVHIFLRAGRRRARVIEYEQCDGVYERNKLQTRVALLLPTNYCLSEEDGALFIDGTDDRGWTLDGYVIPRMASALIAVREVKV